MYGSKVSAISLETPFTSEQSSWKWTGILRTRGTGQKKQLNNGTTIASVKSASNILESHKFHEFNRFNVEFNKMCVEKTSRRMNMQFSIVMAWKWAMYLESKRTKHMNSEALLRISSSERWLLKNIVLISVSFAEWIAETCVLKLSLRCRISCIMALNCGSYDAIVSVKALVAFENTV